MIRIASRAEPAGALWADGTSHLVMSPLEFLRQHSGWPVCGRQIRACCFGNGSIPGGWWCLPDVHLQALKQSAAASRNRLRSDDSPASAGLALSGVTGTEYNATKLATKRRMPIALPLAYTRACWAGGDLSWCAVLHPQREAAGSPVGRRGCAGRRAGGRHDAHTGKNTGPRHTPARGLRVPRLVRSALRRSVGRHRKRRRDNAPRHTGNR